MAAPLLAEVVGGTGFLGFIAAVAFATILAVVAGLTLSGAAALSHDLWVNVVRGGKAPEREQLLVARVATVRPRLSPRSCSASPSRARTWPTWWASPSPSRPARTSPPWCCPSSGGASPPAAPRPACSPGTVSRPAPDLPLPHHPGPDPEARERAVSPQEPRPRHHSARRSWWGSWSRSSPPSPSPRRATRRSNSGSTSGPWPAPTDRLQ